MRKMYAVYSIEYARPALPMDYIDGWTDEENFTGAYENCDDELLMSVFTEKDKALDYLANCKPYTGIYTENGIDILAVYVFFVAEVLANESGQIGQIEEITDIKAEPLYPTVGAESDFDVLAWESKYWEGLR